MTFSVDPSALEGYAGLLARARDDAQQCSTYFTDAVPNLSPGIDGLINPLCYEHEAVQRTLGAMLGRLVTLLDASQDEVAAAAARYRQTDDDAEATIDAAYPDVLRPRPRRD